MNDDLNKREQLSALVDGEAQLNHIQAALSFAESDEGQQSWGMYHLIGDVLRSPELAHHCQHDILSGVRAHMEREPVSAMKPIDGIQGIHLPGVIGDAHDPVAAGVSQGGLRNTRPAANASIFRWKMAAGFASVAAVAAVGWGVMLAGSGALNGGQGGAQLAQVNPNVVLASAAPTVASLADSNNLMSASTYGESGLSAEAQSSTAVAVAGPNGQTVMLRDSRLDELLAAHPQYSSAPNLQMPASFLRNASFATATRH